ncbi:hypothetical protein JCM11641_007538 [Rhodosporidiobolus odoratus]
MHFSLVAFLAGFAGLVSAAAAAAVRQVDGWQAAGCCYREYSADLLNLPFLRLPQCGAAGCPVCGIEYKGECYGGLTFDGRNPAIDSSKGNLAYETDASAICRGSNAAYKYSPNEAFPSYAGYEYQSCTSSLLAHVVCAGRLTSLPLQASPTSLATSARSKNSVASSAGTVTGCLDACKDENATYCALSYYGVCK